MLAHERKRQFVRNRILGSLSPSAFDYIRPLLEPVSLKERSVLQEPNRQVEYVNFIETGVISLMTLAAGNILETAMVGPRGVAPVSVVLGGRTCGHRSTVLVAGNALRIRVDDFERSMHECPELREQLLRYVQALMIHGSQMALCGVRHQLEQRLASWLCLACWGLGGDILPITHDHLSLVLGFRRAGVTQTLKRFEEQGLIRKTRGNLQVCDRDMLELKACSCFRIIESAYRLPKRSEFVVPKLFAESVASSEKW